MLPAHERASAQADPQIRRQVQGQFLHFRNGARSVRGLRAGSHPELPGTGGHRMRGTAFRDVQPFAGVSVFPGGVPGTGRPARRADRSALRRNAPCLPQYGTYLQQRSGTGRGSDGLQGRACRGCGSRARLAQPELCLPPGGVRSPQASAQELPPLGRHRLPVLEPPMARISAHGGQVFRVGARRQRLR